MINNYIKVARYEGERVDSQTFPFDDRDESATAIAYAHALSFPGTLSIFRRVAGVDLPEIAPGVSVPTAFVDWPDDYAGAP